MTTTRSHHHCADRDRAGRVKKSDTLPDEHASRIYVAQHDPDYARTMIKRGLLTAADVGMPSPAKSLESGSMREIQGILEASRMLCLPAPKVEMPVLLSRWSLTTQHEMGDIAWMAFGEVMDAWKMDFCGATGFVTVYDAKMDLVNVGQWNGLTYKVSTPNRVTFYGSQKILLERLPDFAAVGSHTSQIVRDLPFVENMNYRYHSGYEPVLRNPVKRTKAA